MADREQQAQAQDDVRTTHSSLHVQSDDRSSRRPVLIALYGPNPGTVHAIPGEVILGRSNDASISVDDDRVSRRHTRIIVIGPDEVRLEDLGSKNGTWVNGKRVAAAELQSGDTIQIGNETIFQFTYRDPIEQRLLERQKMEAIGRLAGGVAHEFNNLLAVVLGNLSQLQRHIQAGDTGPEAQLDMLRDAVSAATRATEMTHQLLGIARRARVSDTPVNVSALVEDLARLVSHTLIRDIQLELDVEPELYICGQAPELQQALLNLCLNARDAMPEGGVLTLRVHRVEGAHLPGPCVELSVEDTGMGMDDDTLKHVFEPFFTTKELGRGTGLGMSIVHGIVTGHQGQIDIQSEVGQGTSVIIVLPCVPPPPVVAPTLAPRPAPSAHKTILLVEDDEALRRSVTRMLEHLGHRVWIAADGVEAVEVFRRHVDDIDVVLLDVGMPRQGGARTFDEMRAIAPDVKVLLSSGYHGDHLEPLLRAGVHGFLPKPYTLQQLVDALQAVA
jgi:two-component system cell cycle sensor histidine kinase/response regulator CckA